MRLGLGCSCTYRDALGLRTDLQSLLGEQLDLLRADSSGVSVRRNDTELLGKIEEVGVLAGGAEDLGGLEAAVGCELREKQSSS